MAIPLDQFVRRLTESGLLSADDVGAFVESLLAGERPQDSQQLARLLVKAKKLTAYQAQEVYKGNGKGLVLGNYVILDKLGQGGMGMVLKAEHKRMKRLVALKVLSPSVTKTPEALARFQREVEAAAKLRHPHIVAADDADEAGGVHFLVMEYVEGINLSALVKKSGPLSVEKALHCLVQAARGLEYAHQEGVIHRDIKPANLLLDGKGTVKILDMGLARFEASAAGGGRADLTGTGQIMGTVDYMAPEQAMNTKNADQRADIYSLGISLWYLVTGTVAYDGETLMEVLMAHQTKPIPSLREACPQVSAELEAVFTKMVAKTPQARYQSMTEVIADLARCPTGEVSAPAIGSASRSESLGGDFLRDVTPAGVPVVAANTSPKTKTFSPADEATLVGMTSRGDPDPRSELSLSQVAPPTPSANDVGRSSSGTLAQSSALHFALLGVGGGAIALVLLVVVIFALTRNGNIPNGQASGEPKPPVEANETPESTGWHGWPRDAPPPALSPFDAGQAKQHQDAWAKHLDTPVEFQNSIGMKFVLIPPGEFMMGSTPADIEEALKFVGELKHRQECIKSEAPRHRAILTQPTYLGIHEVTQFEYGAVTGIAPSHFASTGAGKEAVVGSDTANHPVEMVTWNDATDFCSKLSQMERLTPYRSELREGDAESPQGNGYRLPTEAQWEFACRAGATTKYWIGDKDEDLAKTAWFNVNSNNRTHKVGSLKASPFGLYDVHGNVWEWVRDEWTTSYYGQFKEETALDPLGPSSTDVQRIIRGGQWYSYASSCRASDRGADAPGGRNSYLGFRISLSVEAVRTALAERKTANDDSKSPAPLVPGIPVNFELDLSARVDGASAYVLIPEEFPAGEPLTVEMYAIPHTLSPKSRGLFSLVKAATLKHHGNLWLWEVQTDSATLDVASFSPAVAGRRVHVAGVMTPTESRLYLDGRRVAKVPLSGPLKNESRLLTIGCFTKSPNWEPLDGTIDEVRISTSARYDTKFEPPLRLTPDAQTWGLYHCDEGSGDVLTDSSGNFRHGKVVGGKWVRAVE